MHRLDQPSHAEVSPTAATLPPRSLPVDNARVAAELAVALSTLGRPPLPGR